MIGLGIGLNCMTAGTPSGPLNPTTIPGIQWWLRADKGTTVVTGVSAWADQSGAGDVNRTPVQAVALHQPTLNASNAAYNNQKTIDFGPANDFFLETLGAWSVPLTQPWTLFSVGNDDGSATNMFYTTMGGDWLLYGDTDSKYHSYSNANMTSTTARSTTPSIYEIDYNGAASTLRISQVTPQVTGANETGILLGSGAIDVGSGASGGAPMTGSIAEILAYTSLASGDRTLVRNYLAARYAITVGP